VVMVEIERNILMSFVYLTGVWIEVSDDVRMSISIHLQGIFIYVYCDADIEDVAQPHSNSQLSTSRGNCHDLAFDDSSGFSWQGFT
jgi:hypothetical protein